MVERLGHPGEVIVPLEDLAELEAGVVLDPGARPGRGSGGTSGRAVRRNRGRARARPSGSRRRAGGRRRDWPAPRGRSRSPRNRFPRTWLAASAIVRISPLATTGIRSTASTTARMPCAVHHAREPLLPGPAVDDHPGDANLLELSGEHRRRQRFVVPAQPHLDRHRDRNGLDHGGDEIDRAIDLAEQGGAARRC